MYAFEFEKYKYIKKMCAAVTCVYCLDNIIKIQT